MLCGSNKYVILGPGTPRVIQACPKSPVRGNKTHTSSKFCKKHQWLQQAIERNAKAQQKKDGTTKKHQHAHENKETVRYHFFSSDDEADDLIIIPDNLDHDGKKSVTINLRQYSLQRQSDTFVKSTVDLPDNDDESVLGIKLCITCHLMNFFNLLTRVFILQLRNFRYLKR